VLSRDEKLAILKLVRTESIGPSKFWELMEIHGSGVNILKKWPKIFQNLAKVTEICSDEKISAEVAQMKSLGARFVFFEDELYPPLLRNIPDPPPVLSFLGDRDRVVSFFQRNIIAVVGARNASMHSIKFCEGLCRNLGKNGVAVVSGLARGIDASAHEGSLDGGTIAVVACGLDIVYPQENTKLYQRIMERNGIFSEMPLNTAPQPQLFPRRNRLIAGMSNGTVVIEAAEQSGSLITARMALDYNRDVFAVPGSPQDPRSAGCNQLIREGATLIQGIQDILEQLESKKIIPQQLFDGSHPTMTRISSSDLKKIRKKILNSLSSMPVTIDELISFIKVSPQEVLTALLELELAGKIVRLHGQRVCLALDS
jgi:DNA processing protein